MKIVGLALALAVLAGLSRAAIIIDTGPASSTGPNFLLGGDQQIAGQFELTAVTNIDSVMGWITTEKKYSDETIGGRLDIGIFSDLSSAPGTPLYSGFTHLAGQLAYDWYGLGGLNWVLGAGTYWVVFSSPDGSPIAGNPQFGYMQGDAPVPLNLYSFKNSVLGDQWERSLGGVGVKITGTVPDQTATLLLLGLALAGLLCFRRRG